jgi:hypothetical protein
MAKTSFYLVLAWFVAATHKHNRVLTLRREVLCLTKLEIVARIGSNSALRGIYAAARSQTVRGVLLLLETTSVAVSRPP